MADSASSMNIYRKKMLRGVYISSTGEAQHFVAAPTKDSVCKNTTPKPHKCTILVPLSF